MKQLTCLTFVMGFLTLTAAAAVPPACMRGNQQLAINNKQVIDWKQSTRNQYHDRAFVEGKVVQLLSNRRDHMHLEIDLDPSVNDRADHIEIVYNTEFGAVPSFRPGSTAVVCGDYITSNKDSGHYKASPVGAIIHWVHMSPNTGRHEHGYLMIDGVLTGQDNPNDGNNGGGRNGRGDRNRGKRGGGSNWNQNDDSNDQGNDNFDSNYNGDLNRLFTFWK